MLLNLIVTTPAVPLMQQPTLYRRILAERYPQLHPLLQEFHDLPGGNAEGTFRIIRPPQLFKRLLGALLGMPAAAENVPTSLSVEVFDNGSEQWVRSFGKFRMATWQWSWQNLLLERSGPVTFGIHVEIVDGGTQFITRRVWLLGIPLPLCCAPSVQAIETPVPGGWHATVQLSFPLIGEMLGYEGEIFPTPHS
jgi:hypothetical protein